MEGPTPISALIHAATMVTAGIFMVARMSPLYELSETALTVVIVIGAITTFFMALVAIVQNDIKRVVAYSTLSQLGYMTVALGASAYAAGMFHLVTHAFFKALLFSRAGSVIIPCITAGHAAHGASLQVHADQLRDVLIARSRARHPGFAGFSPRNRSSNARTSPRSPCDFRLLLRGGCVFVTAFYTFRLVS